MIRALRRGVVLLWCLGAVACASAPQAPPAEPTPLVQSELAVPIELRVFGNLRVDTAPSELEVDVLQLSRESAAAAYRESGLFSDFAKAWSAAPLIAEITFLIEANVDPRFATSPLLELFFRRISVSMETRFRNAMGRSLGTIRASQKLRAQAGDLILLSLTDRRVRAAFDTLHRDTLRRAKSRGVFASFGGASAAPTEGAASR